MNFMLELIQTGTFLLKYFQYKEWNHAQRPFFIENKVYFMW